MRKKRGVYQVKRSSKTKKSRLKIIIFGGLFFCLVIGLIYFFIFSSFLRVEKIEIKGAESVSVSEIENIVQNSLSEKFSGIIPLKSLILIPVHEIKADILGVFPKIASVEVNKKFNLDFFGRLAMFIKWVNSGQTDLQSSVNGSNNILEIKIKERESVGVWCQIKMVPAFNGIENNTTTEIIETEERGQCFYLDKEGIIYKESPAMDGSLILVINDLRKRNIGIGEQVISRELMDFILMAKEKLPEILNIRGLNFSIISIQDLRIMTSLGWRIYFNPQKPVDKQIEVLKRVLEEEIKEAREGLEYIDLRIENRAYFKTDK